MFAKQVVVTIGLLAALAFLEGCGEKCTRCDAGEFAAVNCFIGGSPFPQKICAVDATIAASQCIEAGGHYTPVDVCEDTPGGETGPGADGDNESWDPSLSVNYDRATGEYVIDRHALEQLQSDPEPLYGGTTQLREIEEGYFQVASAGDLATALGWRADDILLDVDGYNLAGLADFAEAYTMLAGASRFALTIERERTAVVLRYRVE